MASYNEKRLELFVIWSGRDGYIADYITSSLRAHHENLSIFLDYMIPSDYDELIEFLKRMINRVDGALIIQSEGSIKSEAVGAQVAEAIKVSRQRRDYKVIRIVVDESETPADWQVVPSVTIAHDALGGLLALEKALGISVPRLFISHSSSDAQFCNDLAAGLEGLGFDIWYDKTKLLDGAIILSDIKMGLEKTNYFIVVLSPEAAVSNWVNAEINAALELMIDKRITLFLPVTAVRCHVPPLIRKFKRVEGSFGSPVSAKEAVARVAKAIEAAHKPR